jgi:hypothetical protein
MDMAIYDFTGNRIVNLDFIDIEDDPWVAYVFDAGDTLSISISHCSGPQPSLLKWIGFGSFTSVEHAT